jgi:hypothetical protein
LGFHCSQKDRPGNRTSIGLAAVAALQQGILFTSYPQVLVDRLWIKSQRLQRAAIPLLDTAFRRSSRQILAVRANNPRPLAKVSRRQLP